MRSRRSMVSKSRAGTKLSAQFPHPISSRGMLLGNGDIGVCITARSDALGLHIGKSDSWDIRVSEDQRLSRAAVR